MIEMFGLAVVLFWIVIACIVIGFIFFALASIWKELLIFFLIGVGIIVFAVMALLGA
jgi:hypothetical protein